jgi:hypothetical protein
MGRWQIHIIEAAHIEPTDRNNPAFLYESKEQEPAMLKTFKSALAAAIVLGTASVALADDYTDLVADGIHAPVAQSQVLTTKPVALPQASFKSQNWMDRASQTESGGY